MTFKPVTSLVVRDRQAQGNETEVVLEMTEDAVTITCSLRLPSAAAEFLPAGTVLAFGLPEEVFDVDE